jgi:hypothetical protein
MQNEHAIEEANRLRFAERQRRAVAAAVEAARLQRLSDLGIEVRKAPTPAPAEPSEQLAKILGKGAPKGKAKPAPAAPAKVAETPAEAPVVDVEPQIDESPADAVASDTPDAEK